MINKYNMTKEQNIFLAKRNIVDYIYRSANLEGISVTYPDTVVIYEGFTVSNMREEDYLTILNLRNAWRFVLENLDYEVDYNYICEINRKIGSGIMHKAGYIRKVPVRIGGTTWTPDMPIESQIKEEIADKTSIENETLRAITLMLYIMRKQIFIDGNKRTAILAANQIMISKGVGIVSIPVEHLGEFSEILLKYYETNNMEPAISFIYDKCIDGLNFKWD